MNFFISLVVFTALCALLVFSIRYGLLWLRRLDGYFAEKSKSTYPGFRIYYRLPFSLGAIPEYFFAIILGHDNYFRKNWWALKSAAFISVLVFIAALKSRSAVYDYFTFGIIAEHGFAALLTSGVFVWYLNIVSLLFLGLFVLICIEAIRMYRFFAPVRIVFVSFMSLALAYITTMTLASLLLLVCLYLAFKIVVLFFFNSKKDAKKETDNGESATSILRKGYREFKAELNAWEEAGAHDPEDAYRESQDTKTTERKAPKITIRRKKPKSVSEEDVPRLHPN